MTPLGAPEFIGVPGSNGCWFVVPEGATHVALALYPAAAVESPPPAELSRSAAELLLLSEGERPSTLEAARAACFGAHDLGAVSESAATGLPLMGARSILIRDSGALGCAAIVRGRLIWGSP